MWYKFILGTYSRRLLYFVVTRDVRRTTKNELNIPYSSRKRAKYDVYGTDLPEGTKFIKDLIAI